MKLSRNQFVIVLICFLPCYILYRAGRQEFAAIGMIILFGLYVGMIGYNKLTGKQQKNEIFTQNNLIKKRTSDVKGIEYEEVFNNYGKEKTPGVETGLYDHDEAIAEIKKDLDTMNQVYKKKISDVVVIEDGRDDFAFSLKKDKEDTVYLTDENKSNICKEVMEKLQMFRDATEKALANAQGENEDEIKYVSYGNVYDYYCYTLSSMIHSIVLLTRDKVTKEPNEDIEETE